MTDCLFCKIVAGEIKPDLVYENPNLLAFRDINPQAPFHVLIIPKQHIANLNQLDDSGLAGQLFLAAAEIAQAQGYAESGYRTVINCNDQGGQTVHHLHLHVLAGRQMQWPPG